MEYKIFKGKYKVYRNGEIRCDNILINQPMRGKYKGVSLDGKPYYVHRIVAELFCEKKEGCEEVDHIDGNKMNNNADNLEWVTRTQNMKRAWEKGLIPKTLDGLMRANEKRKIKVYQIKDGEIIAEFESQHKAAQATKIRQSSISLAIKNHWKAGGYEWQKV